MKRFKALGLIIISVLLSLSVANTASAVILGVPWCHQERSNWCWAACTNMVLTYYGKGLDQCTLATQGLECTYCQPPCDDDGACNLVNAMCTGATCFPKHNHGISQLLTNNGVSVYSCGAGTISECAAVKLIDYAGTPFIIRKSDGVGHFIVIYGYDGTYFHYRDPWSGSGSCTYDTLLSGWSDTLTLANYNAYQSEVNLYYDYGTCTNSIVTVTGCEQTTHTEWSGTATCAGFWWTNALCGYWESYCETGWDIGGFAPTGYPCQCE